MDDGSDVFCDYYSGKITRSDLTNFMRKSCDLLIEYNTYCTEDKNLSDSAKEEIIGAVYDMFSDINSRCAVYHCEQEGKSYNSKYNNDLYAYYDSEIYYDWKDVSQLLLDSATNICSDVLGYTADIESYKGRAYANNSFNLEWSFNNQSTKRIASFVDTTVEPPHNFRFFYKQCAYPGTTDAAKQNAGYLSIWSDNDVLELDVPYKILANADVDLKSGETLLSKYISKLTNNPIINAFFKNMQIYHTNYGVTYYNMLQANLVRQNPHLYQG
ncbi:MAG: hypothetical protein K5883_09410 [Pseudobutyrivibrio sp.]|nr:hypothetical protein [Pseudobutyrivibrio sp.]